MEVFTAGGDSSPCGTVSGDLEQIIGRPPLTLSAYLEEHATEFVKAPRYLVLGAASALGRLVGRYLLDAVLPDDVARARPRRFSGL